MSTWAAPAGRLMPGDEGCASSDGGRRGVVVPQAGAGGATDLAVATYVVLDVHDRVELTQERGSDRPGSQE